MGIKTPEKVDRIAGFDVVLDDGVPDGEVRLEVDGRVVQTVRVPEHIMRGECVHHAPAKACTRCLKALGLEVARG